MKPTPKSPRKRTSSAQTRRAADNPPYLLVFGAHPDDIEFGCGGVIARETQAGRPTHFIVCSRGEAGTNGTPAERVAESEKAAALLGATVQFVALDGDAHLEMRAAHAIKLAGLIRQIRPAIILTPTVVQNQHPDHWRLGQLVRDAARIARYGGMAELKSQPTHAIDQLLFYAITPDAEPRDIQPLLIDVSAPEVITAWAAAMEAHASQQKTRNYVGLQLARATVNGSRCGATAAIPLFPNDPLVFDSLATLQRSARRF
ncbi:MAG TPA: PIG-L family deacetylase [Opitutaceae bacterium]|nr:PIG-L family deacetylase [Opitutaceae bacterium]